MADETRDDTFDPSTPQADRARMQGLGVGEKELARQDDPTQLGQGDPDDRIQAGPPGKPDEAYDARDGDEVSFSQPSGGAGG